MRPRLVALRGPLAPSTFELGDRPLTIGRDGSSDAHLTDPHVSRRHCQVERDGEQWIVRDLGSTLGTLVNSEPITCRALEHGDRISVCASDFQFRLDDTEDADLEAPSDDEAGIGVRSTLELAVDLEALVSPARLVEALEASQQALETLVRLGTGLGSHSSLTHLAEGVLELVLEAIPAERAVLSFLDEPAEPGPSVVLDRHAPASVLDGGPEAAEISATVCKRVLSQRIGLIAEPGAAGDHGIDLTASLHERKVRALVCVPLLDRERRVLGLLYVDTGSLETRFDEGHLRLLCAIAGVTASALPNLRRLKWLDDERRRLQHSQLRHEMVASSPPMLALLRAVSRVSATDSTVLLRGESGTGKELVASTIHLNGPRADGPFVAINCANLSDTLLESEIFGFERGAFTGADHRHRGRIELAHSGTLFLDEVAELSPAVQAKLLRVLQERSFERLGGHQTIPVDIRLVAATNRDLEAAMRQGRFRSDLYYRLNVIELVLPPLRERGADVRRLALHFCELHCNRLQRPVMSLDPDALACLDAYSWPGNVRELSNAIERAAVLGEGDRIEVHDLPEEVQDAARDRDVEVAYHAAVRSAKRRAIVDALAAAGGNVTRAAEALGLHPNYLHRLIRNLGIRDTLGTLREETQD
jgi:transcriptional regulator with GAF, ATPase, and Fis domain